jgi:hypothetical protein
MSKGLREMDDGRCVQCQSDQTSGSSLLDRNNKEVISE